MTLTSVLKRILLLPRPINIRYFWNFGSLLGLYLVFQLLSGFFLSMRYTSYIRKAFESVNLIDREVNSGNIIHLLHVFGASAFFLFLYIHICRGLYYGSFKFIYVWLRGVTILLLSMAAAFLGYVLPWGQMSYWGATVITKFLSVFPYIGPGMVTWVWGGFSVDYPTLRRFFRLHFIIPFIIRFFVVLHVLFLHNYGSNNPLYTSSHGDKVRFNPYFIYKDLLGYLIRFFLLIIFLFYYESFIESQNFIQSNRLVTPEHIQPEWYFLSAYAVLRAVPNKLGGVVFLFSFVLILYFLPLISNIGYTNHSVIFISVWWFWIFNFLFLIWLGSCPVEDPYIDLCRFSTFIYFVFYFLLYFLY